MINMNNMKSIRLMHILSIAAMLLSFVVTADAQRVRNGFPEITLWEFAFRGEPNSIDCIYNKNNNELFLSGFDTDGKGTFWLPVAILCVCRASREQNCSGGVRFLRRARS